MWRAKKRLFSEFDIDVVVASDWMLDMVQRSPVTSHLENVHLIPFGIDTRLYAPDEAKASSRARLGIPEDDFVVLFRASSWDVKGLPYIIDALGTIQPTSPTTLLTLGQRGLVQGLQRDYRIVEMGWVEDEVLYPLVFSACDVFLMPSLAEAFGLMAVEAMAAGRPVVCFEGTALPAVTHAPECGIAVPAGDASALRAAVDRLAADPSEAARRGRLGRSIVAEDYGFERYLDSMAQMYRSVLYRHRA
jgi:glycosyltransferase involved in cell wall biosynthesis